MEVSCFREDDSIKVFVRVRPPANMDGDMDHGVCLEVNGDNNAIILKCKPEAKVFTFDQVANVFTTQVCKYLNILCIFKDVPFNMGRGEQHILSIVIRLLPFKG